MIQATHYILIAVVSVLFCRIKVTPANHKHFAAVLYHLN